jgi:hypothetical protein
MRVNCHATAGKQKETKKAKGNEVSYEHSKLKLLVRSSVLITLLASLAIPDHIAVDYDHHANFARLHNYSWGKVQTANSIWDARVRNAINTQLAAKGWTQVPSGGEITVVAVERTQVQQQIDTLYDGCGGRRFFGGFGYATTTVQNYKVGTPVVDMYDTASKNLIWRGNSSNALSGNPEKNDKTMHKEVKKMFQHFPPEARS